MPPPNKSDPSTTLSTQKSTFLTRQIRLLSTPLTLPHPANASTTTTPTIPPTVLEPLLPKLNKKITSHNRLSFPLQSQRHVLEQVEGVYWRDVLSQGLPVGKCETVVGRDVDLTRGDVLEGLSGWGDVVFREDEDVDGEEGGRARKRRRRSIGRDNDRDQEHEAHEQDEYDGESDSETTSTQSNRYQTLHSHLTSLTTRRDHLRQKLSALHRLKAKLEPFEDPQTNIQPNLVWKGNKEVEAEIARMRVLLVRCAEAERIRGGIEDGQEEGRGRRAGEDGDGMQTQTMTQQQRVEAVLGLG